MLAVLEGVEEELGVQGGLLRVVGRGGGGGRGGSAELVGMRGKIYDIAEGGFSRGTRDIGCNSVRNGLVVRLGNWLRGWRAGGG